MDRNPFAFFVEGAAPRAIYLSGAPYVLPQYKGRGQQLKLLPCSSEPTPPPSFTADFSGGLGLGGVYGEFVLRLTSDPALSLECNQRKFDLGDKCSLWSCDGHPEWAVRWVYDLTTRTLSPSKNRGLVLGVDSTTLVPMLVAPDSPQQCLVLDRSGKTAAKVEQLRLQLERKAAAESRALIEQAQALSTPDLLEQLSVHGFAHLPNAVAPHLVRAALREVNRELGASSGRDTFRAKTFAQRAEVTALFNSSVLPLVMSRLLGPLPSAARYHQGSGQLALRFPGDMCPGSEPDAFTPASFEALRLGWHIDGLPNNFLPGLTDHFGEIHNFDCLVGVLLEDVVERTSGELCVYPGSHLALAEHFRATNLLPRLYSEGNAALPTGPATDRVLQYTAPHHCLGKAGDVYLLNYTTAHFVNANTSPRIRYAVYFRVRGPAFGSSLHNLDGLLHPTAHWRLHEVDALSTAAGASVGSAATSGAPAGEAEQIASDERLAWSLAANNDFTVPQEFRKMPV